MTKIEFKNLPDTTTPLNAENMNQLQTNVETSINSTIQWKLVSEVNGNTRIDLPANWNEIIIVCTYNDNRFRCMTFTLPYGAPTEQYLRLSFYGDASDNANVGYWYGANNDITLHWYNIGGTAQTLSNIKTQIYYR